MELLGKAGPDRRCLISHQKHSWLPAGAEQCSAQVTWEACELQFPAGRSHHTAPSSGGTPSVKLFTRGHNQSPRPISVHVALYSRSPNRGTLWYVCDPPWTCAPLGGLSLLPLLLHGSSSRVFITVICASASLLAP